MPLTLDQYADYLDTRGLPWPAPPPVEKPRARPHLEPQPNVRAVLWTVYGTLLNISTGELLFEHPNAFIMETALDKTITEFKMWGSMSRKPGQPAEYMRALYDKELLLLRGAGPPGERHPEVPSDRLWEALVKKLFQKDYKFDAGFYGSLNEFSRKVAYFFHASLQGTACYSGAAAAVHHVANAGLVQGLCGDGQCFTATQLARGLRAQTAELALEAVIPPGLRAVSAELRARKPSESILRHAVQALAAQGVKPDEVLHVGSNLARDLIPAKRLGMRTALFAGDKASLAATAEQLKEPASRPDVLLTDLDQIAEVVG
jgi:hypothetical protein